jgi:hypothetical protein
MIGIRSSTDSALYSVSLCRICENITVQVCQIPDVRFSFLFSFLESPF